MKVYFARHIAFMRSAPALHSGLLMLIGVSAALTPCWQLVLPLLLLLIPELVIRRYGPFLASISILAGTFFVTSYRHPPLPAHCDGLVGTAYFSVERLSETASPFTKSLRYTGVCKWFKADSGERIKNLPLSISLPLNGQIKGGSDHLVRGKLVKRGNYYLLKNTEWVKIPDSTGYAEMRYSAKKAIKKKINRQTDSASHESSLLTALATGDSSDRFLQFFLVTAGLQHLLAISGFHFAAFTFITYWLLRPLCTKRAATLALIPVATAYLALIGYSPSVFRAWVATCCFLIAKIFNIHSSAINLLGVALMAELLLSPIQSQTVSFQLSFLATAAIILFYRPIESLLSRCLVQYKLPTALKMSLLDQHIYLISHYFRSTLSLTLAIYFVLTPALLYYFHSVPLLGLLYNLYIPPLIALLFALLLFALLLPSPLCSPLFFLAEKLAHFTLIPIFQPPMRLHYALQVEGVPLTPLILFLTLALALAIHLPEERSSLPLIY